MLSGERRTGRVYLIKGEVMPHLIIEYAEGLANAAEVEALLDALHATALDSGLFAESHIKVRAIPVHHYRTAGRREPFIHAQLRIHIGRSREQKQQLSGAVLATICGQPWARCLVNVEVVDMDKETYAKSSG